MGVLPRSGFGLAGGGARHAARRGRWPRHVRGTGGGCLQARQTIRRDCARVGAWSLHRRRSRGGYRRHVDAHGVTSRRLESLCRVFNHIGGNLSAYSVMPEHAAVTQGRDTAKAPLRDNMLDYSIEFVRYGSSADFIRANIFSLYCYRKRSLFNFPFGLAKVAVCFRFKPVDQPVPIETCPD